MNFLKKQGVAWIITIALILIGIGLGRTTVSDPVPEPIGPSQSYAPSATAPLLKSYVFDDANILSSSEERALDDLNNQLLDSMGVLVACVTTKDGRSDIYDLALDYADRIGLADYDFIIVVDMSSQQYILVQGSGLIDLFTDRDCEEYADRYLLDGLDRGDYGDAFMELAEALADWYEAHYVA